MRFGQVFLQLQHAISAQPLSPKRLAVQRFDATQYDAKLREILNLRDCRAERLVCRALSVMCVCGTLLLSQLLLGIWLMPS